MTCSFIEGLSAQAIACGPDPPLAVHDHDVVSQRLFEGVTDLSDGEVSGTDEFMNREWAPLRAKAVRTRLSFLVGEELLGTLGRSCCVSLGAGGLRVGTQGIQSRERRFARSGQDVARLTSTDVVSPRRERICASAFSRSTAVHSLTSQYN